MIAKTPKTNVTIVLIKYKTPIINTMLKRIILSIEPIFFSFEKFI